MKAQQLLIAGILAAFTLMPSLAKADGELVSFGDGDRVTERSLSTGQNMVDTVIDASAESPTIQEEFVAGGVSGPNQGGYVDPSTNI